MATSRFTTKPTQPKAAPRSRVKPTVVDVDAKVVDDHGGDPINPLPQAEQPKATPFERLHAKIHGAYAEFLAESNEPGPKQRIAAAVLGAVTAFGLGYLGGWFSALMMSLVLIVTGSTFLGFMAYLIGVLITLYTSTIVGVAVTEWINSIKPGPLAARVRGLFNRNNVEAAHA